MKAVIVALRKLAKWLWFGAWEPRLGGSRRISDEQRSSSSPEDTHNGPSNSGTPDGIADGSSDSGTPDGIADGSSDSGIPDEIADGSSDSGTPDEIADGSSDSGTPDEIADGSSDSGTPDEIVDGSSDSGTPDEIADGSSDSGTPDEIADGSSDSGTSDDIADGSSDSRTPDEIADEHLAQAGPHKPKPEPPKIGGRRGQQPNNAEPRPRPSSPSRPELICRKNPASAMWEIILTTDDDCQLEEVNLGDVPLEMTDLQYHVLPLTGHLSVLCRNGQEYDMPLFQDAPLIFKLGDNWAGEGHGNKQITKGHFIVIAPKRWERMGHVPVESDGCADPKFRAHYFHWGGPPEDPNIGGFREWGDIRAATGIELTGQRIFDNSDHGELFVGDAPELKSSPHIAWARIGEEAENGWGENFKPQKQSLAEVLDDREGHFFLRVYDSDMNRSDSLEFRYLRNLRQIEIGGAEYTQHTVFVPSSTGYSPVEIRFIGTDGSTLSPALPHQNSPAEEFSDVIKVSPHPDADRISCSLASDTCDVNIVLDLARLWWRLEDSRSDNGMWHDKPLKMERAEFLRHAKAKVSLSLLPRIFFLPQPLDSIRAGFTDEPDQSYRQKTLNDLISIPLNNFVDYAQIRQRLNQDAHFSVKWAGKLVPLIVISADPVPEIVSFIANPTKIIAGEEATLEWMARNTDDVHVAIDPDLDLGEVESAGTCTIRPTETTTYKLSLISSSTDCISRTITVTVHLPPTRDKPLNACVLSRFGVWRNGKGFSFNELRDAGLTVKEAMSRSIPTDRRRRTLYRVNVDKLKSLPNA